MDERGLASLPVAGRLDDLARSTVVLPREMHYGRVRSMETPVSATPKYPPKYPPVLVRRYAGSRLYDTVARRYLTIDDLRRWRTDGVAFLVRDSETGEDITRVLLA
jgi:hypothetical protein